MKKRLIYLMLTVLMLTCLFACKEKDTNKNDVTATITSEPTVTTTKVVEPPVIEPTPEPVINRASIAEVGDILFHDSQILRGYDKETDTFDYSHAFKYFTKYLQEPDYMVANLETTLAGRYNGRKQDVLGYCEYPRFNTPEILAKNMKDAGIDMVTTVNNHSMDSNYKGLVSTLDYLDEAGLEHIGTYRDIEERNKLFIKEINGITFGMTAYTYCTNGISYKEDYSVKDLKLYFATDEIRDACIQAMKDEIKALDESGVDFVIVNIHAGAEYQQLPDSWQKKMVDAAFEAGADIIIAGHPHVVQPMEIRQIGEGENARTGYLIYSMGNFVSSQRFNSEKPTQHKDLGTLIGFEFQKIDDEQATVERIYLVPTITYWSSEEISVLPVMEAYENPDSFEILDNNRGKFNRIEFAKDYIINHLTQYLDNEIKYENYIFDIVLE